GRSPGAAGSRWSGIWGFIRLPGRADEEAGDAVVGPEAPLHFHDAVVLVEAGPAHEGPELAARGGFFSQELRLVPVRLERVPAQLFQILAREHLAHPRREVVVELVELAVVEQLRVEPDPRTHPGIDRF